MKHWLVHAGAFFGAALLISGAASGQQPPKDKKARFVGRLIVDMSTGSDGRKVKLVEPYGFIDAAGRAWTAPAGAVVDGASIPRPFWSIIGGPFEGLYRDASVIHDYYCDRRSRSWQDVHQVFFDAMIARGVSAAKAKTMFYAVYRYGPRWDARGVYYCNPLGIDCAKRERRPHAYYPRVPSNILPEKPEPYWIGEIVELSSNDYPSAMAADVRRIEAHIEAANPDLSDIKALANRVGLSNLPPAEYYEEDEPDIER